MPITQNQIEPLKKKLTKYEQKTKLCSLSDLGDGLLLSLLRRLGERERDLKTSKYFVGVKNKNNKNKHPAARKTILSKIKCMGDVLHKCTHIHVYSFCKNKGKFSWKVTIFSLHFISF